ncbi:MULTISPECIES: DUF262 domain-containing protein [Halobacterium]|uniref:DUF262 domain-containing protein n=1 Tax=Halobacterium TaxID=2239 RepID=UPI0009E68948|nr:MULTISPECIES: DUF262 domain-containing protein [Halobacterium]MCG1003298.1 DUF262 domain-containing HNH endonuclease family protein [Halobacterium noricense]
MDGNPDDNFSLSSVFSQSYFEIPDYQRDFAWEESNVNDLLDDIEFVYEQNRDAADQAQKVDHYFGTIVLEERGSIEPTDFEDYTQFAIVDGQQRLATITVIISAIIEEMKDIAAKADVGENMQSDIEERSSDIRSKYVEYEDLPRLQLGGLAEDVYYGAIIGGRNVERYSEKSDLVETERKVLAAKRVTKSKLQEWKSQKCDGDREHAIYYKFLKNIVRIITQRFEVNVKVVEDVDEAARMFKVINNRGRGLRLHDKVRSHLVYCASQSKTLDSENIYKKFNNIVQNVSVHDGFSDAEIDDLVRIHWSVFTSERSDSRAKRPGPSEIHRRLSDLDDYASVQRDDFEAFIRPYIDSLERFSERYPYLTDRDKFAEKYSGNEFGSTDGQLDETVRKIQLIYLHPGVRNAAAPLLITVAEKFGVDSQEFADIVSELEQLVFGHSLVMSHGPQAYSNTLKSGANDLYWSDVEDDEVPTVFNSDADRYVGHQSKELGVRNIIERISEKRERIAPIDDVVSGYLSEEDVLDGEFSPGWGGIRKTELVKFIMYEYERSLRNKSGVLSLPPYHQFRDRFQVEHIVPKHAEAGHKLENHNRNKNRLGNLVVLSAEENNSNNNSSYAEKQQNAYGDSSLQVLRQLNSNEFTEEVITEREENELFSFIRQRWG